MLLLILLLNGVLCFFNFSTSYAAGPQKREPDSAQSPITYKQAWLVIVHEHMKGPLVIF